MDNIYQKWEEEYIKNLDLNQVKWIKLDGKELIKFIDLNYLDKKTWDYVLNPKASSVFASPIGLKYLNIHLENPNYNFLLGIVKNNIGKYTIVADICYIDEYYLFNNQKEPLTYISYVEVNSYLWQQGLFKEICKELFSYINPNQHMICSMESDMGKEIHIGEKMKKILQENGFEKEIFINDYNINNNTLHDLVCGNVRKRK